MGLEASVGGTPCVVTERVNSTFAWCLVPPGVGAADITVWIGGQSSSDPLGRGAPSGDASRWRDGVNPPVLMARALPELWATQVIHPSNDSILVESASPASCLATSNGSAVSMGLRGGISSGAGASTGARLDTLGGETIALRGLNFGFISTRDARDMELPMGCASIATGSGWHVWIGDDECSNVVVISNSELQCESPPGLG